MDRARWRFVAFVSMTFSPMPAKHAADLIQQWIAEAQGKHGNCIVGLSGGKTPKVVYEKLGVRCQVLGVRFWKNVHFFLVDERHVTPDHPESNQRLVRETLLKRLPVPEEHCVFPDTMLPIDACVADYARRLKALWKDHLPDLVILGMGTDGHIASLFPSLTDLALGDERLVLHTCAPEGIGPPAARDRISISLNAICAAERQVLLLSGEKKQQTWEEMMASPEDERRWPIKRIIATGNLTVMRPEAATA